MHVGDSAIDYLKKNIQIEDTAESSHWKYYNRNVRFNNNKFYLLEINTQPGMTKLSLVPEIAAHRGIKFEDLVDWMVKDASIKR